MNITKELPYRKTKQFSRCCRDFSHIYKRSKFKFNKSTLINTTREINRIRKNFVTVIVAGQKVSLMNFVIVILIIILASNDKNYLIKQSEGK